MSTLELKELSHPAGEVIKIASGKTLDLKTQGSVTMPTGSVLQIVGNVTTTQLQQTATTTDAIVNGLSKAIVPKGANSKFLVTVRWFGECDSAWGIMFNIHMNSSRVNSSGGRGHGLATPQQSYIANDNDSTPESVCFSTLVSSSSSIGTSITFSFVFDSNSSVTFWNNRCYGTPSVSAEQGSSEIIITEIQG